MRKLATFLDKVDVTGTTNMIVGFEHAFKMRPSLLWVVTDGDFPDNNATLAAVQRLNPRGACRINTMLMGSATDAPASMVQVLKDLAARNGGICYDSTGKRLPPGRAAPPTPPARPATTTGPKFGGMKEADLPRGPSIFDERIPTDTGTSN